jgi:type I restriction enzyme, S subunit
LSHNVAQEGTWPVVSIGEVVAINPRPSDDTLADDALASFIPMKCVEEESGRFEPLSDRKVADVRKGYTPFRDGDVLFAKVTPCMENGKGAVMKGLTNGIGFGSTEFFALRPADCLDAAYLFHFVLQSSFRQQAARNMTGAVGLRRVPKSYLEQQPIPLPPLPEQRRIVAEIEKQFTRLEAGVSALKRVQANLKRYRAAVLKAACEGRLVPTEVELQKSGSGVSPLKQNRDGSATFETGEQLLKRILAERRKNWIVAAASRRRSLEKQSRDGSATGQYKEPAAPDTSNLPPIPEGWTWCMSDALFSFITSGSRGWAEYYSEDGSIFLRIGNLDHENIRLDLSEVQHVKPPTGAEGVRTGVQANDILISITADVGMVGLVPSGLGEAYINQHVALARPLPNVSPTYVAYYLCASEGGWGHLKKLQRGATKVGLGLDDIRSVPIPLPPLAEQTRIVAEVERRLSVIDELESVVSDNLQRAGRLRQAVLQKAFTGGIVS